MPAVGSQMFTDVDSELRRLGAADYSISLFGGEFPGLANLEAGPLTASSMNHIKDASPGVKVNGIKKESNYNKMNEMTGRSENIYSGGGGSLAGGRSPTKSPTSDSKITMLEKVRRSQGIWFQPETDRQKAENILRDCDMGLFIVRASSLARTLALSVKIPGEQEAKNNLSTDEEVGTNQAKTKCQRVEHYLIESTGPQLALEGSDINFSTLSALVHYYMQNRNELPVPLRLPTLINNADTHQQLRSVLHGNTAADFWRSSASSANIDISFSATSMVLDVADDAQPPITVQFSSRRLLARSSRLSPESTAGNPVSESDDTIFSSLEGIRYRESTTRNTFINRPGKIVSDSHVNHTLPKPSQSSRLSSKASDYEDIWSLTGTKSPDYAMSDPDGSNDHSSVDLDTSSSSAKAVGLALRDLDALGIWIESELHDQKNNPLVPEINTEASQFAHQSVPALKEEMRVIRRGKRRFAGPVVSSHNRFSAPNLSVNLEDLVRESSESPVEDSLKTESIYSSVHDLSESQLEPVDAVLPAAEFPERDADDFVSYTPPRKCIPSRDQNIIESFQSKVVALRRIGSKLLSRKSSLKDMNHNSTMPKNFGHKESPIQERVMVFRSKKPSYDTCWPVDNSNWSVNRITPAASEISSGTTSSRTSADFNGRHLTIRSSKSPAGTSPKRSRTFSEFTDITHDLEREISLERIVNYVVKNTRADFALSLQIAIFLERFAAAPADDPNQLFEDLRAYCSSVETYILHEHQTVLEDFATRDFMAEDEVKRSSLDIYVYSAVQRLIIEPLCPKLIWNLQAKLGSCGDLARLEKGCLILDATELSADDTAPEIHYTVIEKLSAITAHLKNFSEAQNLLTKGKQLFVVFSDIFGIDANPMDCNFTDLISAFAVAIAKAKAYTIEIHLEFIWQLQPVEFKSASYFPVLLAASCAASALKRLATDGKLHLRQVIGTCMVPAVVSVISREDCPTITQNIQVPLDRRLLGNHLVQLISAICDLPTDALMTLQITAGCFGIVQGKESVLLPAYERWRAIFPDSVLTLLVQTKAADGE